MPTSSTTSSPLIYVIKPDTGHNYFLIFPAHQYVGNCWYRHKRVSLRTAISRAVSGVHSSKNYHNHSAVQSFSALPNNNYRIAHTLDLSNYPELFL